MAGLTMVMRSTMNAVRAETVMPPMSSLRFVRCVPPAAFTVSAGVIFGPVRSSASSIASGHGGVYRVGLEFPHTMGVKKIPGYKTPRNFYAVFGVDSAGFRTVHALNMGEER